jgi:hypothetical protein
MLKLLQLLKIPKMFLRGKKKPIKLIVRKKWWEVGVWLEAGLMNVCK